MSNAAPLAFQPERDAEKALVLRDDLADEQLVRESLHAPVSVGHVDLGDLGRLRRRRARRRAQLFLSSLAQRANLGDDLLPDALVAPHPHGLQAQQLAERARAEALQRVHHARAQSQLRKRRGLRGVGEQGLVVRLVAVAGRGRDRGAVDVTERLVPLRAHLLGIVEAPVGVTRERDAEEMNQPLAHRRVESVALERRLALERRRVSGAVTPQRQLTGGHLVQRHGGRVALGGHVPACGLS